MRIERYILIGLAAVGLCGTTCGRSFAQDPLFGAAPPLELGADDDEAFTDGPPPGAVPPANVTPAKAAPTGAIDAATIDGCQVVARIDGQIVQACEVLWHVNKIIEKNQDKIPPDQINRLRQELIKQEIGGLMDRKLLYGEFIRNVPAENIPHIQEKLQEPFEQREMPQLMKQLDVRSPLDLEHELTRLGSSMSDVRQTFNEKAIASEWLRTKVKVSEEVSPDEMLQFYQLHLSNYEEPTRVRWEELTIRKSRFKSPAEAYAEIANMGNEVWQRAAAQQSLRGPAFIEVAKARSDGYKAKEEGGQHDWTNKGALSIASIDNALFTLQVGQMSPIIETDDAFYIVRVLERKEAGRKPFADVQAKIRDDLRDERFRLAVEKYVGKLRKDARIWTAFTGEISAEELVARKGDEGSRR